MNNNLCENCCGSFEFQVENIRVTYILRVEEVKRKTYDEDELEMLRVERKFFCGEQCLIEWLTKEKRHE